MVLNLVLSKVGLGKVEVFSVPTAASSLFPLPPQTRVMVVREHPVSSVAPKLALCLQ